MEFHLWFIIGAMLVIVGGMFALAHVIDQRDEAIREANRWREVVSRIELVTRRKGQS